VFSRKLTKPWHCARYFFDLLVFTSRIYGHNLTLRQMEREVPTQPSQSSGPQNIARQMSVELALRKKFWTRIESLPCWSDFDPMNGYENENQLRTQNDYIHALGLHLPEIHGETINIQSCVRTVRDECGFSGSSLARMLVALEHAAHHASYCRHTLETLSQEYSWGSFPTREAHDLLVCVGIDSRPI